MAGGVLRLVCHGKSYRSRNDDVIARGKKGGTVKVRRPQFVRPSRRIRHETNRPVLPIDESVAKVEVFDPTDGIPAGDSAATQTPGIIRRKFDEVVGDRWGNLAARHKLVAACSAAFVICNMDKVNMSVAIIPMAEEFGWGASVSGLVQSGFFWGYLLSQIPGGYLCSKFGGRKVLPCGVGLWSFATASVPFMAGTLPGMILSRATVGLGEAVAPSAATDMVARSVPVEERSRAISIIFGGLHLGSILGLLVAPWLIQEFGWPSVFVAFGVAGMAWTAWFEKVLEGIEIDDSVAYASLVDSNHASDQPGVGTETELEVPWRAILRSRPVRALAFTHFCNNWFAYTMMSWLPSYFTDTLSLNLTDAAHVSLVPPVAGIIIAGLAGQSADALVSRGWKTATVRKLAQCTAFLGPSACLIAASMTDDNFWNVGLVTFALGLSSFSMGGLYCNHQDLSPKYASFLLGLTNATAAVPGIIGVWLTGYLLDVTQQWSIALFLPSILLFLVGSGVYTIYGRSDPEDFTDNRPFEIEEQLRGVAGNLFPKRD